MCRCWGGLGTWACVQKELNNSKVLVLDGSYIDKENIYVDKEEFEYVDLNSRSELKKISVKYDLIISLEVAEHLPKERADSFVGDLCALGDVILFSAAIPGQGGEGHINEQFLSYWKDLFEKRGYRLYDIIRNKVQGDKKICSWYRQNVVLFVNDKTSIHERLQERNLDYDTVEDIVLPETYLVQLNKIEEFRKSKLGKLFIIINGLLTKIIRRKEKSNN